jgi:hypothetical protein
MIVRLCVVACACIISLQAIAQPVSTPPERKSYVYVGLQANQLIRQLFSLGNPPAVANPYLLTITTNDRVTGVGFATGIGYTYNQARTGDNFNLVDVSTGDFALRMGIEKKMIISGRWIWSIAGDAVFHKVKEVSKGANPSTTSVTSTTTITEGGIGPRCGIYFSLADRVLLGTEASFYMSFGKEKNTVVGTPLPAEPERTFRNFTPSVPAALFLIMRF